MGQRDMRDGIGGADKATGPGKRTGRGRGQARFARSHGRTRQFAGSLRLRRNHSAARLPKPVALALTGGVAASVMMFLVIPVTPSASELPASLSAVVQSLSQEAGLASMAPAQATIFAGTPAVGALFTTTTGGGLGDHFCTASVVDSPHGDLVVTAAHCVSSVPPSKVVFVPDYHDGKTPYGVWGVTRVIVDRKWASSAGQDDDVAFLVVSLPGKGRVEDVTGSERLGVGQPSGQMVRVVGYPSGADAPIHCANRVRMFGPSQLEFDCAGYTEGTSGSPLLTGVSPSTGLGTVIGVIGGYEQGGYTPDVSYAARFGANVAALYKVAVSES
jgi:V8-like Glu-specific endopeptidase